VVVVGGGVAGAAVGAVLGRLGIVTRVIDPHPEPLPDFRCEKLEGGQLELARRAGLEQAIRAVSTPVETLWIARRGRVIDRRPDTQVDARYPDFVRALRGEIGGGASLGTGKVASVHLAPDAQRVVLVGGGELRARLVVLATGLQPALAASVGMTREVLSPCHSVSVGFDMTCASGVFPFPALTWYSSDVASRIAYLTLFPLDGPGGRIQRANLFVYRQLDDPWLRAVRERPLAVIQDALPGLAEVIGPCAVTGPVHVRKADLLRTSAVGVPGVVAVGDACGTSCPAAGTGLDKVLTDVLALARHAPEWLRSPGMSAEKVASYYEDSEKVRCDAWSLGRAWATRDHALGSSLRWRARRRLVAAAQGAVGRWRAVTR
jgi:2-polyprenyl-6-methoxyphenol hydroxylase-like FAD-dependent oxidoreductase